MCILIAQSLLKMRVCVCCVGAIYCQTFISVSLHLAVLKMRNFQLYTKCFSSFTLLAVSLAMFRLDSSSSSPSSGRSHANPSLIPLLCLYTRHNGIGLIRAYSVAPNTGGSLLGTIFTHLKLPQVCQQCPLPLCK